MRPGFGDDWQPARALGGDGDGTRLATNGFGDNGSSSQGLTVGWTKNSPSENNADVRQRFVGRVIDATNHPLSIPLLIAVVGT